MTNNKPEAVPSLGIVAVSVQGKPVGFCEDTTLTLAERVFSTEIDEQLASDIIQYASRLHSRFQVIQQPTEQQPALDVNMSEIIRAVANYVGSQKGGPFTPAVIKAAIISQLEYGDVFTDLFTSPTSSHSQQSEKTEVSALVDALEELVGLVEDYRQGEYIIDSLTTQPARIALTAYRKQGSV